MSIKSFGLPYTGSKNRIAPWLMEMLPDCEHFVDVFAGGCAVSHAMILYGKARKITLNDLQGDVVNLFIDALNGDLDKYAPYQWIDRKTFFDQKDNNPLVKLVYSFGNNGKDYLYSRQLEEYKHSVHMALIDNDWTLFNDLCPELSEKCKNELLKFPIIENDYSKSIRERYLKFNKKCIEILREISGNNLYSDFIQQHPFYRTAKKERISHVKSNTEISGITASQDILSILRIESVQPSSHFAKIYRINQTNNNINNLPVINAQSMDYRLLDIPNNSVVFCDPPYKDSDVKYNNIKFDHEEFYNWCIEKSKNNDVYVTEYSIEHPNFKLIGEKARLVSMNAQGSQRVKIERLYKVIS